MKSPTSTKIEIVYDANWPERNWAREVGWHGRERLYVISALALGGQLVGMAYFLGALRWSAQQGVIPWWYNLYKIYPLMVQAGIYFLAALSFWAD